MVDSRFQGFVEPKNSEDSNDRGSQSNDRQPNMREMDIIRSLAIRARCLSNLCDNENDGHDDWELERSDRRCGVFLYCSCCGEIFLAFVIVLLYKGTEEKEEGGECEGFVEVFDGFEIFGAVVPEDGGERCNGEDGDHEDYSDDMSLFFGRE